jgi:hypothetical protein
MSAIELSSSEVSPVPAAAETAWPFIKRWVLAFSAIFFLLTNWWFPWAYLPGLQIVADWINKGWDAVVVPVAAHVFHATASTTFTGSGDTVYNFVQFAISIAAALAGGLAFALFDRTRAHWERLRSSRSAPRRRTALLGALLSAAAMANVVALNFCYDVPVKLYSTVYLIEALVIAAPDFRRMARFFVLDRPVPARRRMAAAAVAILVVAVAATQLSQSAQTLRTLGYLSPRSPLRGIWTVDELTDNGASRPPLTTDLQRWRRFVFDSPRAARIQLMNDAHFRYLFALDEKAKSFKLTDWENSAF